jgi:hypothetical protein
MHIAVQLCLLFRTAPAGEQRWLFVDSAYPRGYSAAMVRHNTPSRASAMESSRVAFARSANIALCDYYWVSTLDKDVHGKHVQSAAQTSGEIAHDISYLAQLCTVWPPFGQRTGQKDVHGMHVRLVAQISGKVAHHIAYDAQQCAVWPLSLDKGHARKARAIVSADLRGDCASHHLQCATMGRVTTIRTAHITDTCTESMDSLDTQREIAHRTFYNARQCASSPLFGQHTSQRRKVEGTQSFRT